MNTYNIYNNNKEELSQFTDDRGSITDIFYLKNINHACIITCAPRSIRGNHYHKVSTQHILIVKGSMDYISKKVGSNDKPNVFRAQVGDVVTSEPNEIHTMKITDEGCTFIAFAEGVRGGNDYEKDTYRVDSIIE